MILTRTLEFACDTGELDAISEALDMLRNRDYDGAARVLIARHDMLTSKPQTKLYNQREERL